MSLSEDPNLTKPEETAVSQLSLLGRLSSYTSGWRWVPTSESELGQSETKIFSYLRRKFQCYAVDVSPEEKKEGEGETKRRCCRPEERKIWTIEMEDPKTDRSPIVLLHGFAASIGFWALNLDSLSMHRKVYAIDLIGFGRSTRPDLSKKEHPEDDIVDSIELWRKNVGIEKPFILLGHSFGSYIAASYALKYGENLERLILADPWGFSQKSVSDDIIKRNVPIWVKAIFKISLLFNPLAIIRVAGPCGPRLMTVRDDLRRKFIPLMGEDSKEILNYAYHSNANRPSGEIVFKKLLQSDLSTKRPIIMRARELDPKIKLNFVYASQSWLYREEEDNIRKVLPNYQIDYKIIQNAGHHLYSDNAEEFNDYINNLEANS